MTKYIVLAVVLPMLFLVWTVHSHPTSQAAPPEPEVRSEELVSASGLVERISAGGNHSCGLKSDGTLACWGGDRSGQASPPAGTFSQVSAGGWHNCALKTDSTLACWDITTRVEPARRLAASARLAPVGSTPAG